MKEMKTPPGENESICADTHGKTSEDVTPQLLPLKPVQSSPRGTPEETLKQPDLLAMGREMMRRDWQARLQKHMYFEDFPGLFGGDYQLLYLGNRIYVSARDAAWAATCVEYLGSTYSASDIVEKLDIRDWIAVPGLNSVACQFIPLETMCSWLDETELAMDADEFFFLLDEFQKRKSFAARG